LRRRPESRHSRAAARPFFAWIPAYAGTTMLLSLAKLEAHGFSFFPAAALSRHHAAAVDHDRLAGDERAARGGEEDCRAGDFVRFADAPKWVRPYDVIVDLRVLP